MPKPYQKKRVGGRKFGGRKPGQKTHVLSKELVKDLKKYTGMKRLAIRGQYPSGTRVKGRGAYSLTQIGEKIISPFMDDTPSQGRVNKIARKIGSAVGGSFLPGLGQEIGNASSWLSRAFGFGDYTIKKNSFQDYQNIAQFSNHGAIVFSHREFVTDINSTTGFLNSSYPINPGNSTLFPWLSTIARNFEQYEFLGLIFEFKSTSANAVGSVNTGLGTVIMATDYDVLDSKYADKRAMEVAEFATSAPPCENQIHPIECDPKQNVMKQLFIQRGNNVASYPDDPRFSALGNFQLATSGMQAVSTIGELWVSYHIKLLKPQLENGSTTSTTSIQASVTTAAGGTPTITAVKTTNPGALTVTLGTGSKVVVTCASIAGIGTYVLSSAVVSSAISPVYTIPTETIVAGGSATFNSLATSVSGITNTRTLNTVLVASQKTGTTSVYDYNPQATMTIISFAAVGDTITYPLVYSAASNSYIDMYMAPYSTNFLSLVGKPETSEIQALKKLFIDTQTRCQKNENDFIELKKELEEDNTYEVTVNSDDVARLMDKLSSVNLVKNSPAEVEECLKNTVDMLGKNLSLSDRIRLEHYYTNLKKFHL